MSTTETEHTAHPNTLFLKVFIVLAGLTVLEVAAILIQFPLYTTLAILLGVGAVKVYFIAAFFMHLKWDHPVLSKTAAVPFFFLGVMLLGIGLTSPGPAGSAGEAFLAWCGL